MSDVSLSSEMNSRNDESSNTIAIVGRKIPVVSEGLVSLQNRYEELDALCRSLSACLDNVAEEVSVGAGLLLSSNHSNSSGAQALASHVRTVKNQREQLLEEYERYQDTYQNSLDELLYYIQQYNIKYKTNGKFPPEIRAEDISDWWQENMKNLKVGPKVSMPPPNMPDEPMTIPTEVADISNDNEDEQRKKEQQMITQIMMLETKIRRIRATMSDLSDENQRNQGEIERRHLMVGLQYIRTLRNEIRDVEYQIYELKQYDIDCRSKIRTLQNYLSTSSSVPTLSNDTNNIVSAAATTNTLSSSTHQDSEQDISQESITASSSGKQIRCANDVIDETMGLTQNEIHTNNTNTVSKPSNSNYSDKVDDYASTQRDYTTTMVVHGPTRGFLSLNLWQILLRIIGMGSASESGSRERNGRSNSSNTTTRSSEANRYSRSSSDASATRPVIII
jgi:hypothetical protein